MNDGLRQQAFLPKAVVRTGRRRYHRPCAIGRDSDPGGTMCDENSIDDMIEFAQRRSELTRLRFGALSLGVGMTMMLPKVVGAAEVTESDVQIKTPDGLADAYFVHPSGGQHAGVLI